MRHFAVESGKSKGQAAANQWGEVSALASNVAGHLEKMGFKP